MPKGPARPECYFLIEKRMKRAKIAELLDMHLNSVHRYGSRWREGKERLISKHIIDLKGRVLIK